MYIPIYSSFSKKEQKPLGQNNPRKTYFLLLKFSLIFVFMCFIFIVTISRIVEQPAQTRFCGDE